MYIEQVNLVTTLGHVNGYRQGDLGIEILADDQTRPGIGLAEDPKGLVPDAGLAQAPAQLRCQLIAVERR